MRSIEQRRAYIETSRRSQPLSELLRKAEKARGRLGRKSGVNCSVDGADLTLARHWRWRLEYFKNSSHHHNFCWNCHRFGQQPWDEKEKRYSGPIIHAVGCVFGPDDGPHPGWNAAGRPALSISEERAAP